MTVSINFRGLTCETFTLRWKTHLSNLGRAVLVREAFEDCDRMRPQDIVRFGFMDYDRMFDDISRISWEVLQEVHNRLAGDHRHYGRKPSVYTEYLLAFVPPDQFVPPDD
jgi:hypothetical protein